MYCRIDNQSVNVMVDGNPINLGLWDTPGNVYECLNYQNTDLNMQCCTVCKGSATVSLKASQLVTT